MYTDEDTTKLVKEIGEHLEGYTFASPYEGVAQLHGPDDAVLHFRRPYNDHGRMIIKGLFPRHSDGSPVHLNREDIAEIGVSASRDGTALAKDITRRLLPHYLETMARVKERIKIQSEQDARVRAAAEKIVALIPGSEISGAGMSQTSVHLYMDPGSVDLRIDSDASVTAKVSYIPFALGERLAKVIGEYVSEAKASSSPGR